MTIWVLQEPLTPGEEAHIQERTQLTLPFDGLPDLSMITSQIECRHLSQALNPDDPPETVARKTERVWKLYAGLHEEDIIAVPLKSRKEMALAEVTERYRYGVEPDGSDVHQARVKWYDTRIKFSAFAKHKSILDGRTESMSEVTDPEARAAIRNRLPHSYNRFAKWKWLLVIFFIMGLLRQVQHLMQR